MIFISHSRPAFIICERLLKQQTGIKATPHPTLKIYTHKNKQKAYTRERDANNLRVDTYTVLAYIFVCFHLVLFETHIVIVHCNKTYNYPLPNTKLIYFPTYT